MLVLPILLRVLASGALLVLVAGDRLGSEATAQSAPPARAASAGNPITGEGLPNPAPKVTRNWGQLPAGRKWGTSAGIDIDPKDGNVWAYERCGAGTAGGGARSICDNNPVDPVFKFDRNTGAVLANFGKGVDGDAARHPRRQGGQRVDRRLRRQQGRHQGAPGPQVQPEGREAAEPRHRRQAGQRRRPVQPAQRRRRRARRQHLRVRRPRRAGHDHRRGHRRGPQARRHGAHQQVLAGRQVHQVVGRDRRASTASSARRTR